MTRAARDVTPTHTGKNGGEVVAIFDFVEGPALAPRTEFPQLTHEGNQLLSQLAAVLGLC